MHGVKDASGRPQKDSLEEKRSKRVDEEIYEIEKQINELSDVKALRSFAKTELRAEIRRKLILKDELTESQALLCDVTKDKKLLTSELRVAQAELSVRPFVIEVLQRRIVPVWLLNGEYESASVKWAVPLEFQLTQGARILVDRINRFKDADLDFGILDVSEMFPRIYDALTKTSSHDEKPRKIELLDEEWKPLFEKLSIPEPEIQAAFKELVKPINREERLKAPVKDVKDEYVLYIKYLNINLRQDGVPQTTDLIKSISGDKFAKKFHKFYYPVNAQRKYTNEVFIHAKQIGLDEVKELKTVLESFKLQGKEKVIFVYHELFKM